MNVILGRGACHLCGAECDVKTTKKGKAYMTCGECGQQTFARGEAANSILKGRVKASPVEAAKPESLPEVAPVKVEAKEPPTVFDLLMGMGK